jgi:rSAM/selenodomain-associated transferase 2/rSAM/selenodomain-associated transferase 1
MRVSVIVPTLDEAHGIASTLAPLQALRAQGHEVIVVDGGSRDATLERAAPLADHAFVARRGRAAQMNAGAAAADGNVLLFLHADTRIAPEAVADLGTELTRAQRRWGRFDVTIAGRSRALRVVARMMNLRSRLTGIATGDQGIFVTRALFDRVGGYPDQPLMEDIELSRRLKRAGGPPLCLCTRIVTSARRWEQHGLARTVLAMWRLRFAYWRGAEPTRLVLRYPNARTVSRGSGPPVLQVFAKAPVPGHVKTRLAHAIGSAEAAVLHADLVERTLATACAARAAGIVDAVELWCAPDTGDPAFARWRDRFQVTLATQVGHDLGERMQHALTCALARGTPAVLIGTDCPLIDVEYLAQAARALVTHDAAFGPVEDGGYVLVGLARSIDAFGGIAWGEPGVMATTRARLAALGASWHELPTLWDLDREEDLARWHRWAGRGPTTTVTATA